MGLFRELGEILYPWPLSCLCCGAPDEGDDALCPECRMKLGAQASVYGFAGGEFAVSAAAHIYAGPAGALVRALKYRTLSALADDMAGDMIQTANNIGMPRPDVVTYVPMHWRRRQGRFINQAQVLANAVAREWGIAPDKSLKRVRACRQQARISESEARISNVKDAFAARHGLEGRRVVLIDDVYTTGATARECAAALKAAGARKVDLLVYSLAGEGGRQGPLIEPQEDTDIPF